MAEHDEHSIPPYPPPPYSPSPSPPPHYPPPTAPTAEYNPPPVQATAPPATAETTQLARYHDDVDGHRIEVDRLRGHPDDRIYVYVDRHRRHGDDHRIDVYRQRRHDDDHRTNVDRQRRHGDHRTDVDRQRRHGDDHRIEVYRQRRHDDDHRTDVDRQRRHGDDHRIEVYRQRRHDDDHRTDVDRQRRHGDDNRTDAERQRRHDDDHRTGADRQRRHGDDDRTDVDTLTEHPNDHRGDVNGVQQNHAGDKVEGGFQNASNTFSGFIDIMYNSKKLPWGSVLNTIYILGLSIYFLINLIYSIVATSVQRDHLAYRLVYMSISLIGFVIELLVIIIRKCLTDDEDDDYKRAIVFIDYVISSLGELLIYPTLICVMYGFVNERAWQFDDAISICIFILLVYSVIMDALYMKFYVIFLMIRVLCASYDMYDHMYDELARHTKAKWKRCFTPVYLSILFAIATALIHWLMTGIIGVRIYVDNFTPETNDTNSRIPNTGDYRVVAFTGYMIGCTIFLPVLSWITYIIINKQWFYEVYSAISVLQSADHMQRDDNRYKWKEKLVDPITDPLAYIAIVLMVSFIAFAVGTYLPDYQSSEYEVASSARDWIHRLGFFFIGFFLLSNLQATIIFMIALCGLPILCGLLCYKRYK